MAINRNYVAIIQGIASNDDLNKAIKLAYRMFGYDKEPTQDALHGVRKDKVNFLRIAAEDPDADLAADFFTKIARLSSVDFEEPAEEKPARGKKPTARGKKPAARAAKPARAKATRKAAADDVDGKIVIAGDPVKIAEALSSRVEVANRGTTVICQRQAFCVEAHAGKGVTISGFATSHVNKPLRYVRNRLGDTPWIKRARVVIGELPENKMERFGLRANRSGEIVIEDR